MIAEPSDAALAGRKPELDTARPDQEPDKTSVDIATSRADTRDDAGRTFHQAVGRWSAGLPPTRRS